MSLQDLIQRAEVWRGGAASPVAGLPTGFIELDALLGGVGWPQGALTEILAPRAGGMGLGLLLPTLARLSRDDRWIVFVAPPYIPYAPALARAGMNLSRILWVHAPRGLDALWAAEQSLRAGTCAAVLVWPATVDATRLRRLQLAAETGDALGVLFRTERSAVESSPAALRLKLEPAAEGLGVYVIKRRGGWPAGPILLSLSHALAVHSFPESRPRRVRPRRFRG
jgi:hypothetical protein